MNKVSNTLLAWIVLTVKLSEIALSCEGLVGVAMTMEQSKMVPQMQKIEAKQKLNLFTILYLL